MRRTLTTTVVVVLLLNSLVACSSDLKDASTQDDFCAHFGQMLNVFADEPASTEQIDDAITDFLAAACA